jgi:hypothetical protein
MPTLGKIDSASWTNWKRVTIAQLDTAGMLHVVETSVASARIKKERGAMMATSKSESAQNREKGGDSKQASAATPAGSSSMVSMSEEEECDDKDIQASKRAYAVLLLALTSKELRLCGHVEHGDAHGVWQVLLDTYERRSTATRVQLMEMLFKIRLMRSESVALYVSRLTEVERKLASQGERIGGAQMLFLLLRGVERAYPTLVTLLKMNDALTFEGAVIACENEEERQRMSGGGGGGFGSSRAGSEESFHVSASVKKMVKEARTCYGCNKIGHVKKDCPQVKCMRCRGHGHMAAACRATQPVDEDEVNAMLCMAAADRGEEVDWDTLSC